MANSVASPNKGFQRRGRRARRGNWQSKSVTGL